MHSKATIFPVGPRAVGLALLTLAAAASTNAQDPAFVADQVLGVTEWRTVGPVNFGGRVVDIAADPKDRFTWYAATGTGGIWKTTNNGTTFESIFDVDGVISVGDIAVAPSDGRTIYVGTGEANNQRSSYWGNGVWKSTDAGKTWKHVGLDGTDHIGRVVVHPANPDVVYVAAAGALYSPNRERGLYKTSDGGETWECVQWISEDVGFIDVALNPAKPDELLAASYDRRRKAWNFRDTGEGSGLWRSTDAGATWKQVAGLPAGRHGRIGVEFHSGGEIAYCILENGNAAPPRSGRRRRAAPPQPDSELDPRFDQELYPFGASKSATAVDDAPNPIGGECYRSEDGGKTWKKVSEKPVGGSPHYYYGQVRVDPNDPEHLFAMGVRVFESKDGGKTWSTDFGNRLHVDHHALWIDPNDSLRCLLGNDGGIAQTWDGGATWDYHDDLPVAQFYAVGVDMREPYNIYGGTQDNGSWGIPSRQSTNLPLARRHAFKIGGGDGFYVEVDPTDPDVIYGESQFGGLYRHHLDTGDTARIKPQSRRGEPRLRFNWMTPIVISPHDPHTIYVGSQFVHRSDDRGDSWEVISPDLTTNDAERLRGDVPHCTITTIAESPRQKGLLWVGTDDGRVWQTQDGGARWLELTDRMAGVPDRLWVSRVAPSPHDPDRAYVSFTGYREDLRDPYLFLTTDRGVSFRSIAGGLPPGESVNVVREHPWNDQCVLVGTEFGCYASIDGGATFHALGDGLPTVPVHDLVVHPREGDVIVATHGRGFWILDAAWLGELTADALAKPHHVFEPRDGRLAGREFASVRYPGDRGWSAANAELAASFRYYLSRDLSEAVTIEVLDVTGEQVFSTDGRSTAGLHEVTWRPRGRRARAATAGEYRVRFEIGDAEETRVVRVWPAPRSPY